MLGTLPRWLQTEVACSDWSIGLGLIHHATATKARDPFLRIRKKIGPTMNRTTIKQTTLAIVNSVEEEALTPIRGLS